MNTSLKLNYQELIFNDKDYEDVFSESFFYSPETFDEEDLGHLFLVGKVKSKVEKRQGPVFLLNYIASKLSQNYYTYVNHKIKDALSNSLEIVNRLIRDLYYKKEIDWLQDMFLLAGVIHKNKIYFSILNKGIIFLCRGDKIQDLISRDLTKTKSAGNKDETYFFDKIFKADITLEDKLLVATHLEHPLSIKPDYFNNPDSFKRQAVGLGNRSFAAMLIYFGDIKESEKSFEAKPPEVLAGQKKSFVGRSGEVFAKTRIVFDYLLRIFSLLKLFSINPKIKFKFKISKRKLLVFLAGAGFLLIAALGTFEIQKNRSIKSELDKARGYLDAFYSFDYEDAAERRRFLNEARVIFEKYTYLPEVETELREVQFLLKNLDLIQFFSKIKIISLDKLMFSPNKMILRGRSLLALDGANMSAIDLLREEVGSAESLFNQKLEPALIQHQKDKIYALMLQAGKMLVYDLKIKSISEKNIKIPDGANIIAMQLYQDFVYLLSKEGMIYKYPLSNLTKYENWFKKNHNFQSTLNFGIDGKIYVLDSNGIYRFLKGESELESNLSAYQIKNFWLTPERFDFFIGWSDNYIYLLSKKDLTIQKIIISSKLNKVQDVVLDDNNTFYILQDKEIITAFIE